MKKVMMNKHVGDQSPWLFNEKRGARWNCKPLNYFIEYRIDIGKIEWQTN